MKGEPHIMSKILGYVLVGLGSAALTGGATFYITQRVVKKKCKEKYEADLSWQLNCCRDYYKKKIKDISNGDPCKESKPEDKVAPNDEVVEEYDSIEEAEAKNNINGVVVRNEKTYKIRASEIAQEVEVHNYHKMYGEPTVDVVIDDDEEDEVDIPIIEPEGPHCIRKEVFWDNEDGNDLVEIHLYTGDFVRNEDGEKEYLEIFYCNGYLNDKRDEDGNLIYSLDDPWRERVIKSSEAAAMFGDEWRKWIGNGEWDSVNEYGFDYDKNEVCIKNDLIHTDFIITRVDEMYKVAIEGKKPGDPFDYDKVR